MNSTKRHLRTYGWRRLQHHVASSLSPNIVTSAAQSDIHDDIAQLVNEYADKVQTSVSLQMLMRTGRGEMLPRFIQNENKDQQYKTTASERILIQVAGFIQHEMPIRLAQRIKDLDQVPLLKDMKSVQAVKDIYISSFLTLIKEPSIDNMVQEALFARKLELLYERHSNILVQMARGAYELREAIRNGSLQAQQRVHGSHRPWEEDQDSVQFEHYDDCHSFLDRFYTSRIGIRVLAGQYLALRQPPFSGYVGLICQNTSPYDIVKMAIRDATFMCTKKYGDAPNVLIKGRLDLTFAYIPTHLHYIVLELLKNAMRATVEHHGIYNPNSWPSVEVVIADGVTNEDIAIKISDEGGGISRSNMKKIWSYLFTTADDSVQTALMSLAGSGDHSVEAPLAGLGYGLPISRAYAKYFGGDLSVMSMEGYGTDVFLHLRRLGDSVEPLPI